MKKFITGLLAAILLAGNAAAKEVAIEEITKNPAGYEGELITVTGLVTQYRQGTSTSTSFYMIRGDFGGTIQVNTAEGKPETNLKYRVTGIVYFDIKTRSAFISEKRREKIPAAATARDTVYVVEPPATLETAQKWYRKGNIQLIAGLGIVLAGLLAILLWRRKEQSATETGHTGGEEPESEIGSAAARGAEPLKDAPAHDAGYDFKTIKIYRAADPKTLLFIPGQLTIISGADSGKSFKIAGYPTPDGNIVTIGRDKVSGDRYYAHIQLVERTVSRRQAELIMKDGKLTVKNLS